MSARTIAIFSASVLAFLGVANCQNPEPEPVETMKSESVVTLDFADSEPMVVELPISTAVFAAQLSERSKTYSVVETLIAPKTTPRKIGEGADIVWRIDGGFATDPTVNTVYYAFIEKDSVTYIQSTRSYGNPY